MGEGVNAHSSYGWGKLMEKITGIYLCGESASNFNSSRVVVLNSDTPHDFSWLSRPWPSPSRSSFLFPLLAVWALVGASGMIVSSPFLSTYHATDKRSIIGPTSPGETHLEHKKLHQVSPPQYLLTPPQYLRKSLRLRWEGPAASPFPPWVFHISGPEETTKRSGSSREPPSPLRESYFVPRPSPKGWVSDFVPFGRVT